MLSYSTIKELFASIGAPSAAVIVIVVFLFFGWSPVETDLSRSYRAAEAAAIESRHASQVASTMIQQHIDMQRQSSLQLELLLQSLREVCFNTAMTDSRRRACGDLRAGVSVLQ